MMQNPTPAQVRQITQQSPVPPAGMSAETDKVFRRWLKLQISAMYVNALFKLVIFLLIAGSIVFSTFALAPLVESQLSALSKTLGALGGGSGFVAQPMGGGEMDAGVANQLSDEQREMMMEMLSK
jgi:hypothetical protein